MYYLLLINFLHIKLIFNLNSKNEPAIKIRISCLPL